MANPSAARPQFRFYNVKAGIASNEISCIVEDRWGRIYAGSPHGIDQLDPCDDWRSHSPLLVRLASRMELGIRIVLAAAAIGGRRAISDE